MNLLIHAGNSRSACLTEEVLFQFQDLELTRNTMVMRFLDQKRVIPLKEIASYHLKWYLHDPTSARKYWFLVLTVDRRDGHEESEPIVVAEFSRGDDERELREDIEGNIAQAIDLALSWDRDRGESDMFARDTAELTSVTGLN